MISPQSDSFQNTKNIQIEPKLARVAWRVFITAKRLIKTEKIGYTTMRRLADSLCHQTVPSLEPTTTQKKMSHLTVVHHPPGNFWKIPKNAKLHQLA